MTAQVHDPRIGLLPPVIPSTYEPRVARDIRTWSLVARGLRAADRARPLARPPGLAGVARAPASNHAADDTPHRTRTGSRSPRPLPRTSDGTRYIYGACPDHVRPPVSPDRVDHDPAAATARITRRGGSRSRLEVDLYKAAAEASNQIVGDLPDFGSGIVDDHRVQIPTAERSASHRGLQVTHTGAEAE